MSKMRNAIVFSALAACFLLFPQGVKAEKLRGIGIMNVPGSMEELPEDGGDSNKKKSRRNKGAIQVDTSLFTEQPFFSQVKFMKLEPAMSLSERVERLLYGIYTDIPPEYDHYGYEIRRYMSAVGGVQAYEMGETSVEQQLKNINTAGIILDYWEKELEREIEDIDRIITERKDTSNLRTRFKYNRGVVRAFMIECRAWMAANKKVLNYAQDLGEKRFRLNPKTNILAFKSEDEVKHYAKLYKRKLDALGELRGYMPFRMMIY